MFVRLGNRYRGIYIEVFEEEDEYTIITYCGVKPNGEARLFKGFDRLI